LWTSRLGVATLSLASLVGLILYLRQSTLLRQRQTELKLLMQADHDRLDEEVTRRTAELSELTQHLLTAREDERARLARDLHDELGALLTAAKLHAARIHSRLGDSAPQAKERLAQLVSTLNSGIALKRRIIEDLRPSALSTLGLVATLEILAREFEDRSGIAVHLDLHPVAVDAPTDLVVYRIVQEALTNVAKHAQARQAWVLLRQHGGSAELTVRDDGIGFDPHLKPGSAHGLAGMRFRVKAARGTLDLRSGSDPGTTIVVRLPATAPTPMNAC
jgi:signal transduction histidine kinase